MASPRIVDRKPVKVHLEPGKYSWCSCGESKNQPYCDGGHAGSEFKPASFSIEKEKDAFLCLCKHTQGLCGPRPGITNS